MVAAVLAVPEDQVQAEVEARVLLAEATARRSRNNPILPLTGAT